MNENNIIRLEVTDSTNQDAKTMIGSENWQDWKVIVANSQQSGHGKQGSAWFSPEGGLYFSIILPKAGIKDIRIMTILAAFAIASVIKDSYGLEPMIKLPNDIYLSGKKFCGILTENIVSGEDISSVIGIGINANIREFPDDLSATSILLELGKEVDNEKLMQDIVEEFKKYFKEITN